MKFIKKAVSAFLASVMCIPAGVVNIATAEENDTNTVTTVTLSDSCENGIMQFSQECMDASTANQDGFHMIQVDENGDLNQIENDGSIWAFNAGDKVEVELIPDEDYNVKSFTIKSADTGDVMAHKETMDNVFSFTMPNKNLNIEAVFSDSSTIEIISEEKIADGEELSIESKYHDITETSEITQEEVDEVIFDLATESYIKANLNPEYIILGNNFAPVDLLGVKQALFDGRYVEEGDTIDSILYTIENGTDGEEEYEKSELKAISQINSMAYIYDFNEDSDYYVAYANTMIKDEDYSVKDWAFAFNDFSGDGYEGCIYDEETGLFYIPKQLYKDVAEKEGHKPFVMSFQVQFMQVFYNKEAVKNISDTAVPAMQSDVCTVDVNEEENTIDVGMDTQDIFDLETVTTVSAGLDPNNMSVAVNGVIIPKNTYEYDSETGELVIAMSSASIVSVEAWEGEKTLQDEIKKLTAEEAEALSFDEMKAFNSHTLILKENEIPDKNGKYMDNVIKVYGNINYTGRKSQPSDPWYVLSGYEAGAKPLRDWLNNSGSKPAIETKMVNVNSNAGSSYAPMKIDLSNYKLRSSSDKWANALKKFIKVINNCWGSCYHIESPLKMQSGKSEVNLRVVKYKLGKKKTKSNGSWTQEGYVVFGLLTPQICTQTTTALLKIKFKAGGKSEDIDPMALCLYKLNDYGAYDDDGARSLLSDATLAGSVYTVKFFKDTDFSSVKELKKQIKNNGLKASATWQFKTKNTNDFGSGNFSKKAETIDAKLNESYLEVAGIEFNPNNPKKPRDEWNNDFLINKSEKLESYQNKWGKKGTYWVYEEKPPRGFLKDGGMYTMSSDSWITDDVSKGFVVTMAYGDTPDKSILKLNGSKTAGVDVVAGKQPSISMIAAEVPDETDIDSISRCVETNNKHAKPGIITVEDDIMVWPLQLVPNAEYYVTTQLLDKDTGEFLDVSWNESATVVTDQQTGSVRPFSTTITPVDPDERYKIFGSSITVKTTSPGMYTDEDGESIVNPINLTIQGTVDASSLKGHTLVFINYAHVVDPDAHDEPDEPLDDGGDTVVDTSEDGEEWTEPEFDPAHDLTIVTPDDDTGEYIFIDDETENEIYTDIISSQNQRKSGAGDEAIAFAGKYKDESCKESGGEVLQSMTDTINYVRLTHGTTYTIKGWLVDAETGEPVKDAAGNEITVNEDKVVGNESGSFDVTYEFDGTGLGGRKLVSFIEMYKNGVKEFEFKDKNDKKETFLIPEVKTKLIDMDTNTNITAEGESTLIDTISYNNLLPNTEYKVISKLIDTETEDVGVDSSGNKMECESTQKTENESSGEWEVELNFDIDKSGAGKTYVAYEEIYIEKEKAGSGEWVLIAEHKDITDQNQIFN